MRRMTGVAALAAMLLMLCAVTAQAATYEPNQVIVKYADGVSTTQRVACSTAPASPRRSAR